MSATHTFLPGQDRAIHADLYMSLELGDKKWQLTLSDGRRGASRYSVEAGDTAAVLRSIDKARERFEVAAQAKVHSCYEAGRDGWWLHRWLLEQGIDNIVVDSASIEVSRHARRAKTDRLDGDKLLAMLLRHRAGERVWSVLHEPTVADEDERRGHRELARLTKERTAHTNRISSLWYCTTFARGSSSAGATGRAGGTTTASRSHRHCARRSSARARAWRWSSSSSRHWKTLGARSWPMASSHWWRNSAACAPSGPRAPGSWSRSYLAGAALPTGASWPAAWDWRPRPTPAATARSSRASAKRATLAGAHAVRFIALLGLCAAYLQGGLDKLVDFGAAVAETQHFGLPFASATAAATATIVTELAGSALVLSGVYRWLGAHLGLVGGFLLVAWLDLREGHAPSLGGADA
jgi:uncharacterized membrane protein YphA (DoxX/SURF4 family)